MWDSNGSDKSRTCFALVRHFDVSGWASSIGPPEVHDQETTRGLLYQEKS